MPDIEERIPQNVEGRFYVDSSCIDCDNCRQNAPDFFRRDDDIGSSYVYRQPVTEEETEQCIDAMESCPSESIGG